MIIEVDQNRCEGHGLCEELAPAVFRLDDDGFVQIMDVPPAADESVAAAVRSCPVAALRIRS
jgi:ferredoxin